MITLKKGNYTKQQEKLKRWYDKEFYWVQKKNCPVCGSEFYTLDSGQTVCKNGICETKVDEKMNVSR